MSVTAHPLPEIAGAFLKLGLTSFGGPIAHLGYFRNEFVAKRRWLTDDAYAELVALCQFLPGPSSSQVVFALGMQRAGLVGAVLASACFLLPSALLMTGFAYLLASYHTLALSGWIHGLKLAAVAVVAQAVWALGRTLCPDIPRLALAAVSTALVLLVPDARASIGVIALGGAVGWLLYRHTMPPSAAPKWKFERSHGWGTAALVVFVALLVLLPLAATLSDSRDVRLADSFYRSGSLVFGGGHVVLPLLRAEVVPPGLITDDAFLAGYGAAQAVPGPLFSFAAYLGTVVHGGSHAWIGGLIGLFAIFLPAWLLIGGALPFWNSWRQHTWLQAALRGTNAAVVGLLLAALINPVWSEGVTTPIEAAIAVALFVLLELGRCPPWLLVVVAAALGHWFT